MRPLSELTPLAVKCKALGHKAHPKTIRKAQKNSASHQRS